MTEVVLGIAVAVLAISNVVLLIRNGKMDDMLEAAVLAKKNEAAALKESKGLRRSNEYLQRELQRCRKEKRVLLGDDPDRIADHVNRLYKDEVSGGDEAVSGGTPSDDPEVE